MSKYLSTYERLGVHVMASNKAVLQAARKKLKPTVRRKIEFKAARQEYYRAILKAHKDAQELYRHYRF